MYAATAVHEAAHAVVAETRLNMRVAEVVVNDDGSGVTRYEQSAPTRAANSEAASPTPTLEEIEAIRAEVLEHPDPAILAGRVLQRHFTDAEIRELLILRMVGREAETRVGSKEIALLGAGSDMRWERTFLFAFSDKVRSVEMEAATARAIAKDFVEMNWPAISALAAQLMVKRKLTGNEVRAIIEEVAR